MVRDALAELVDNSPKFRKLFEQLNNGDFNFKYKYVVSNIPYTKGLEQFNSGLAGLSKKTSPNDRGFNALITIYINHPEFKILPSALKKRFLLDVIIHETIHAYLFNGHGKFVDHDTGRERDGRRSEHGDSP